MNKNMTFWEKTERKMHQIVGFMPHKLPIGDIEFEDFCLNIFYTYDLPNLRSYKQCIATMIMHLPPQIHKVPLRYFGVSIKKAQANEIAYSMIQKFKKELEEEAKPKEEVKEVPVIEA